MLRRYAGAFPEAYKEDFGASTAVVDLRRLEQLPDLDGLSFDVYTPAPDDPADRRLKIFRTGTPLSLGRTLPMLEQMGIEVLDERPYEIERTDGTSAWVYDFGLKLGEGVDFGPERSAAVLDTLRVLWQGGVEQDGFNALVVRAGLTWQQATVLRAYAKYLRQAGTTFSQGYIEQTLSQNTGIAKLLVELFEARFDPEPDADASDGRQHGRPGRDRRGAGRGVQPGPGPDPALAAEPDHRHPAHQLLPPRRRRRRPGGVRGQAGLRTRSPSCPSRGRKYEIWVYSPRVEGVHLRFGSVARGGLRWSDRREDFRTEVLGLVKAQMVKNTVIVPVGFQGRLRRQVAARPGGGPGRLAGRGHRLLQDASSPRCWS